MMPIDLFVVRFVRSCHATSLAYQATSAFPQRPSRQEAHGSRPGFYLRLNP